MPDQFHRLQMWLATILGIIGAVLYFFAPPEKADLLGGLAVASVGFLTGKFSNGYNLRKRQDGGGR